MNAPVETTLAREIREGLYPDLAIDDYHGDTTAISNTGLNHFAKAPEIYFGRHLDPRRPPAQEKPGQLHGQLAHCAILEPDHFGSRYVIGPAVNKNTNIWKDFVKLNEGKRAIDKEQYDTARYQAESVRKNPDIRKALEKGRPEVSAYWRDPDSDVLCRCRPDWETPIDDAGVVLLDVKTYSDAGRKEFLKQVERKFYYRQAALYTRGYGIAAKVEVYEFIFVAVETEWPYRANAFILGPRTLEKGNREIDELLPRYADCLATNTWPGDNQPIQEIDLSNYLLDR